MAHILKILNEQTGEWESIPAVKGTPATVSETKYQESSSGTVVPTGTWVDSIPSVTAGNFLWTRLKWNNDTYTYFNTKYGDNSSGDMTKATYSPNYTGVLASNADLTTHTGDTTVHITASERSTWNAKQSEHSTTTATLTVAGWSSSAQTVSVSGVTASNSVIVSPAPSSVSDWADAQIYCSAQASGTLTFTCSTTPTSAITVNVIIFD